MHVHRRTSWWIKLAFCALLSHAEQMIFLIMLVWQPSSQRFFSLLPTKNGGSVVANLIIQKLYERLKSCAAFNLALVESTDISDTSLLVIFIRAVTVGFDAVEEFFDMAGLSSTATG